MALSQHPYAIMPVHLLTTTIIHGLLLFRQQANSVSNGRALRNLASRILAFLSMKAQQRPNPFANLATTTGFDLKTGDS
jgi:hypothetical protein